MSIFQICVKNKNRQLVELMFHGFFPMATGIRSKKPRFAANLNNSGIAVIKNWEYLRISKYVRKQSKKYEITINKNTDEVVEAIREYHLKKYKDHWILPKLIDALKRIQRNGGEIKRSDGSTVKKNNS